MTSSLETPAHLTHSHSESAVLNDLRIGAAYTNFGFERGKKQKYLGIEEADELLSFIKTSLDNIKEGIEENSRKLASSIQKGDEKQLDIITKNKQAYQKEREELRQSGTDYCNQHVAKVQEEINKVTSSLREQIQETCGRLEEKFDQASKSMQRETERMIRENDNEVIERLTAHFEERMSALQKRAEDCDDVLDAKMGLLFKQSADNLRKDNEAYNARLSKAHIEFADHVAQQEARHIEVENDLHEIVQKLDKSVAACVRRASDLVDTVRSETTASISSLSKQKEKNWTSIQADLRQLRRKIAEVASSQTRRMEWVIKNASKQLEPPDGAVAGGDGHSLTDSMPSCSLFSPRFEAAGVHGLQLELQTVRHDTPQKAESSDCTLCLWGPVGLSLVFTLFVGGTTVQLQHTFDGKTPCRAKNLCSWRDQVDEEEDTLNVGVDILESIRQDEWVDEFYQGSVQTPVKLNIADGNLVQHRHVNHRLLDLVQDQVDRMRSRMTRQIEWRIEQAASLPKYFPEGECICSTTFEAAGVAGLQLVFYPGGYSGVKKGFCSFFLFCPSGSMLRCWLSAGRQRREARIAFDEPGFFGRTNFCRFDSCIDPADDTVLLALEIEEAQQTVQEALTHQPSAVPLQTDAGLSEIACSRPTTTPRPPSTPRPLTSGMGGRPPSKGCGQLSTKEGPLPGIVESIVKRHRNPGRIALEEVRQLPSIWTSKPIANISEVLDGFYSYRDIKTLKRSANSGRMQNQGNLSAREERGGNTAPLQKGPSGGQLMNNFSDASLSTCTDATIKSSNVGGASKYPRYMMYAA